METCPHGLAPARRPRPCSERLRAEGLRDWTCSGPRWPCSGAVLERASGVPESSDTHPWSTEGQALLLFCYTPGEVPQTPAHPCWPQLPVDAITEC